MFTGLPPGTILTLMYFYQRIKNIIPGTFIEVGPGTGEITKILLKLGWTGIAIDMQPICIEILRLRFSTYIDKNKLQLFQSDFLNLDLSEVVSEGVDLIISNQVMEHLDCDDEAKFLVKSRELLINRNGLFIAIVPSSMAHYSIEDDVVGHYRRYESEYMLKILSRAGFHSQHFAGLTYPLSNLTFKASVYLNNKYERKKLRQSKSEQTLLSGIREVPFKNKFPKWFNIILNENVMYIFFLLQKIFRNHKKSLIQYYEARISRI